jgi:hypothetical protein
MRVFRKNNKHLNLISEVVPRSNNREEKRTMPSKNFVAFFALTVMVFVFFTNQTEAGIIENGLVSYYSFNSIKGDVAKDEWGVSDAAIVGPVAAKGKYGDALTFDGVDDYVNCKNDDSLDITKAISIEAWVNMKNAGSYPAIVTKSGTNWGYIFQFLTTVRQINLYLDGANPSWANVAKTAVTLEKWAHIAATYDGKKIRYYFNGEPDGDYDAVAAAILSNKDEVHIGCRKVAEPHYFTGMIDEVRIYNRALEAAEVKVNMNSDSTAVNPAGSLAVTWGKIK